MIKEEEQIAMKTLGILGGMGPMATIHFAELIVQMTEAEADNEHIPTIIWNQVNIADRTSYMLGKSTKNPLPEIVETLHSLERAGAEIVAVPCVTAHSFYREFASNAKVPVLDIVQESVAALKNAGVKHVLCHQTAL